MASIRYNGRAGSHVHNDGGFWHAPDAAGDAVTKNEREIDEEPGQVRAILAKQLVKGGLFEIVPPAPARKAAKPPVPPLVVPVPPAEPPATSAE